MIYTSLNPLGLLIALKKKKEGKTGLFWGWVPVRREKGEG
jgi:hypothetical protein